jgi:hypothetical protein
MNESGISKVARRSRDTAKWRHPHAMVRVVAAAAVLAGAIVLSACSKTMTSNSEFGIQWPELVHGRLLVPNQYSPVFEMRKPGTAVSARAVFQETLTSDQEAFTEHDHGYGLAFVWSQTYPVMTSNAGLSWQIDGPPFYIAAADGPAFVDQIGTVPPHTVYAWGEAGHVVVSLDGGAHWWSSQFDGVAAMGDQFEGDTRGGETRYALVLVSSIHPFFTYVSTNGGRTWALTR